MDMKQRAFQLELDVRRLRDEAQSLANDLRGRGGYTMAGRVTLNLAAAHQAAKRLAEFANLGD